VRESKHLPAHAHTLRRQLQVRHGDTGHCRDYLLQVSSFSDFVMHSIGAVLMGLGGVLV